MHEGRARRPRAERERRVSLEVIRGVVEVTGYATLAGAGAHAKRIGDELSSRKAEKTLGGLFQLMGKVRKRNLLEIGKMLGGDTRVGRFTPLSTMRDWSQIGGISFDHEGAKRETLDCLDHRMGILKGGNPGERNKAAEFHDATGVFWRSWKAVENGADAVTVFRIDFQAVIEAGLTRPVTSMEDNVELCSGRELEVPMQKLSLTGKKCVRAPAGWGRMEVVQASLPDGRDLVVVQLILKKRFEVVGGLVDITGMDTQAGVNFWILYGELKIGR